VPDRPPHYAILAYHIFLYAILAYTKRDGCKECSHWHSAISWNQMRKSAHTETQRHKENQTINQRSAVSADNRLLMADCHYDIIALLKPQFEAGKAYVKKGGIVSDKQVHIQTIDNLSAFVTEKLGVTVRGLTYSPIHKNIGNIEYLLWLQKSETVMENYNKGSRSVKSLNFVRDVVERAHRAFSSHVTSS
jgi:hypothetical protein